MENENMTPEATGVTEEVTEAEVVETAQPQAIEKFKINYLGEEKELSFEEAKTLAQKGMDYDRQKEKWETHKPIISGFEELARTAGFVDDNGHGDYKAYVEAAKEMQRQQEIDALQQEAPIPKELAEELYLSRKERAERKELEAETAKQKTIEAQNLEFLDFFKEVNGRAFSEKDTFPESVSKAIQNGVPLKYAYAEYLSKTLLDEKKISQKNFENQDTSPGGVSQGTLNKTTFTKEEVKAMSREEVNKNFNQIMQSKKSWI